MASEDLAKKPDTCEQKEEREDYNKTVETCTLDIQKDPNNAEAYSERCRAHLKLDKLDEAIADADMAIQLGAANRKNHFRRALALYYKRDYKAAKDAFQKADDTKESDIPLQAWRNKCDDEQLREEEERKAREPKPQPKVKEDWYQTDTHIVITLLVKNVSKDDVHMSITDDLVVCEIAKLPDGSDHDVTYYLLHPIKSQSATFRVLSTKIEIKLPKVEAIRWERLEGDQKKVEQLTDAQKRRKAKLERENVPKNWDKIIGDMVKEEEEKLEGEGAINHLFQKIYCEGSDEVKMAMNKSFMESGGTVLSTNWNEVEKDKIDVKPPDGMEWKNWN